MSSMAIGPFRGLVHQAVHEEQGTYEHYLALFIPEIIKIRWLKHHDHVQNR